MSKFTNDHRNCSSKTQTRESPKPPLKHERRRPETSFKRETYITELREIRRRVGITNQNSAPRGSKNDERQGCGLCPNPKTHEFCRRLEIYHKGTYKNLCPGKNNKISANGEFSLISVKMGILEYSFGSILWCPKHQLKLVMVVCIESIEFVYEFSFFHIEKNITF